MEKEFIAVAKVLAETLRDNSEGEFRVIGHEPLPGDAREFRGKDRTVRAFYSGGEFSNQTRNQADHNFEITLEMCVTADAEGDLDTLMNESATQAQLAIAMASMRDSAELVNSEWDIFLGLLLDIVGNPSNFSLGLEKYRIKRMELVKAKKDRLLPFGEQAVLTGVLVLGVTVREKMKTSVVPSVQTGNNLSLVGNGE